MINYVIINGVNSNTKNGLGINELPPITKPSMRTQTEEIDGRDGDIITKLGYSAYDKTITIGLFGTGYDVNDIISFFTSEGTITFSNEPDKYYKFTMLEQIDVESLLRFKTASITFHCQPFKYPLSETPLEIEYDYIEQTGENLNINNTAEALMKLSLKGNTSQTGTPTPDTPIPVSVVSGDNTITISNSDNTQSQTYPINLPVENFIDLSQFSTQTQNGITFTKNDNGSITINGTATSDTTLRIPITPIPLVANTTYTFSKGTTYLGANYAMSLRYQDQSAILSTAMDSALSSITFTTTSNISAYYFQIYVINGKTFNNHIVYPMLELGSKANHYTEYGTTPIELCKIGDYQDYFYKDNGTWYLHKEIGKVVLNGSETWNDSGYNASAHHYTYTGANKLGGQTNLLSDKFIVSTVGTLVYSCVGNASNTNITLKMPLDISTTTQMENWLTTNNTIVYYVLATSTNTEITDTTLIGQLDNIQNAMSYSGQTNIGQVNNDKPFIISAKAIEKGTNEVVVNNIGNAYSKPLIALEGNGNVDIYLNNNQILQANVEDKMNIDIDTLEAYNPDTSVLLNRQVIGNYNSMTLPSGNSTIRINGALDKATITNYQRWL